MRFRKHAQIEPIPLQLAPMIDVLFLLLIFFVITWNFARQETEIEIAVPAADEGQVSQNRDVGEIVINVRKTGEVVVESVVLTEPELVKRLKILASIHKDQAVILRGDEKVAYEKVINVLNMCQKAGIWNVSFATRKPEETSTAPAAPQN